MIHVFSLFHGFGGSFLYAVAGSWALNGLPDYWWGLSCGFSCTVFACFYLFFEHESSGMVACCVVCLIGTNSHGTVYF